MIYRWMAIRAYFMDLNCNCYLIYSRESEKKIHWLFQVNIQWWTPWTSENSIIWANIFNLPVQQEPMQIISLYLSSAMQKKTLDKYKIEQIGKTNSNFFHIESKIPIQIYSLGQEDTRALDQSRKNINLTRNNKLVPCKTKKPRTLRVDI